MPRSDFPASPNLLKRLGGNKGFVIKAVPNLPNLPNLFFSLPYARAHVCVNHIKNVGKVGKVGKRIDLAGEKASQPFFEVGKRLGSGVCRG